MAVEIEPLLLKINDLAPRFGRARQDLEAIVSRGRTGDFKGVMQNARLVLEALLRSLVTEELKQTPGKAMLDELVTKFRQQANAGIVPTNILAHMGTVQAWGNLSAHDHAGSLEDSGVQVGQEEVVASLNSMVAILGWYAEKRGLRGESSASASGARPATGSSPALAPVPAPAKGGSRAPLVAGGGVALVAVAVAAWLALRPNTPDPKPQTPSVNPFAALDAVYGAWDEPVPPAACRRPAEAENLARVVNDADKLALLDDPSAEAAYLTARAVWENGKRKATALDVALACKGFANAEHLAGYIAAVAENDNRTAQARYETARALAPTWLKNRIDLAGVLVNTDQLDAASKELEGIISAKPDYGPAYFVRSHVRSKRGDASGAAIDLCQAASLGSNKAAAAAKELGLKCP